MRADFMAISPPPFPRRQDRSRLAPVWVVGGLAALAWITRLALEWRFPLPQCWLRKLTGIPCPACGCTRSLASWASGDLEQALLFNPLFFAVCVGLLLWLALWLAQLTSNRPLLENIHARAARLPRWKMAIALVVTNWLYLYLKLPK